MRHKVGKTGEVNKRTLKELEQRADMNYAYGGEGSTRGNGSRTVSLLQRDAEQTGFQKQERTTEKLQRKPEGETDGTAREGNSREVNQRRCLRRI